MLCHIVLMTGREGSACETSLYPVPQAGPAVQVVRSG